MTETNEPNAATEAGSTSRAGRSSPVALVIGDLHVRSEGDPRPARDVAALLTREASAAVVFAGDTLDLAAEPCASPAEAARRALGCAPELARAIASRAARGIDTTFLAGNHDAAIASPAVRDAIHDALGLDAEGRAHVLCEPWFVRLAGGAVHVEHGHVFDPDGAPSHPLAPDPRDDVGIAILRRFIVPVRAHELVHAHAEAPLHLLLRVIRQFGPRAPAVVARYLATALTTLGESGARFPLATDRAAGTLLLAPFAERCGFDPATLALLLEAHATPTLSRATSTFLRLYLDRVGATSALIAGGSLAVGGGLSGNGALSVAGISVAACGAMALVASMLVGANRYRGRAERVLAEGAERIADITGASTVILGHVHVAAEGPRYRNTSSFAFAREGPRAYLRVERDGAVVRAFG